MKIIKKPYYWVSAHREIEYVFEYDLKFALTNVVGNGGFAVFIFVSDGIHSLNIGDYIYCDTAPYIGYHKVAEKIFSNWYKTETTFDLGNPVSSGTISFVQDKVFTLYSGYESGALSSLLPYTKIAEFKPEPNKNGQLVVNISGYVNKIFDVIHSYKTTLVGSLSVYYNLFNQITLLINGVGIGDAGTLMCLNSSITSFELNRDYVDTGRDLNGGNLGNHYFSCNRSWGIIISDGMVIDSSLYEDGSDVTPPQVFSQTDFDNSDFITG